MTIKETARKNPEGAIAQAFKFAERAHAGQKRKTGEPYFNHVLATAEILNDWHMDEATIVAGLIHDTVEDTPTTREEVKKLFGEEVAFLIDGVTKLGRIKYRGAENKAENLRKMILALSQDLRVIFIKLADRLHNMRTLSILPPPKQKRIALETDEIYASLAYRLGMQNVSGELKDIAFPYLYPKEDKWLKENVADLYAHREQYLTQIKPILEKMLAEHHLHPLQIDFRAKRYSSLYHKLLRYNMDVDKIYDLVAMRVIMKNVSECYAALGVVHELWPPLFARIKDYIAMPKPNGYRSLHTTVIGPEERPVEIQIRTEEMHEENENGIAAHWIYHERRSEGGKTFKSPQKLAEEVGWVQQLRRWQSTHEQGSDSEEFLEAMKVDFFKDRIFAITPRGDVIDLPEGSTPIDFAYHIHTQIGDSCVGAKVNGQFVPLDYKLHSGDLVEILMQKNKKPSEDWLKFVKTSGARDHIRAALRTKNSSFQKERRPTKTEFHVVVEDRVGLLKDITSVIARSHLNITNLRTNTSPGSRFPMDKIQCDTTDKRKIEKVILKLKRIEGVREVSYKLI